MNVKVERKGPSGWYYLISTPDGESRQASKEAYTHAIICKMAGNSASPYIEARADHWHTSLVKGASGRRAYDDLVRRKASGAASLLEIEYHPIDWQGHKSLTEPSRI